MISIYILKVDIHKVPLPHITYRINEKNSRKKEKLYAIAIITDTEHPLVIEFGGLMASSAL